MKYLLLAGALMFGVSATFVCAEEAQKKTGTVVVEETAPSGAEDNLKHIETGPVSEADEAPSSRPRPMQEWESYDQNTGLPNVTESDAAFEYQ